MEESVPIVDGESGGVGWASRSELEKQDKAMMEEVFGKAVGSICSVKSESFGAVVVGEEVALGINGLKAEYRGLVTRILPKSKMGGVWFDILGIGGIDSEKQEHRLLSIASRDVVGVIYNAMIPEDNGASVISRGESLMAAGGSEAGSVGDSDAHLVYGRELILDLYNCNGHKYGWYPIEQFCNKLYAELQLCAGLELGKGSHHWWRDMEGLGPNVKGIIAAHFMSIGIIVVRALYEMAAVCVNVSLNMEFDIARAKKFIVEWFEAENCTQKVAVHYRENK